MEDITVTSNSTQTPCDLSPLPINDDMLPQAHHQNPGHCIASFAAINQMRQNAQVEPKAEFSFSQRRYLLDSHKAPQQQK